MRYVIAQFGTEHIPYKDNVAGSNPANKNGYTKYPLDDNKLKVGDNNYNNERKTN